MRSVLVLPALLALALPTSAQTTWYVDRNATPPGDGSQASPFVSIQQAIAAPTTVDLDTIVVAPGDYVETIDFLHKALTVRSSDGPLATKLRPSAPADTVVTIGEEGATGFDYGSLLEGFSILRDQPYSGTGVTVLVNSFVALRRCIVTGHAIGVDNHYDADLGSCTIVGNAIGVNAGTSLAAHFVHSSIVRGNSDTDLDPGHIFFTILRYSDFRDAPAICATFNCQGNIDVDPLFWDEAGGDFHLLPGSPCIDTGFPADPLDPDGSQIDMGALTYDPTPGTSASCFGTGCPCGNDDPTAGCANSTGKGGRLEAFGTTSVSGDDLTLVASQLPPGNQGLVYMGDALVSSPLYDGIQCALGNTFRFLGSIQNTGPTGVMIYSGLVASSGGLIVSGTTWHFHAWHRDFPLSPCGTGANFTHVLTVSFTP